MSKEKEIKEIERIKSLLEYHFKKYKEYEYKSQKASRKNDRSKASNEMLTCARYIENELCNPLINSAMIDGKPHQFEDFWRYVNSDLPDYLSKIDSLLEKLKSK